MAHGSNHRPSQLNIAAGKRPRASSRRAIVREGTLETLDIILIQLLADLLTARRRRARTGSAIP